jgi:hypothetical protein
LKRSLHKSAILVLKKEGKLQRNEKWTVNDQTTEAACKINCN